MAATIPSGLNAPLEMEDLEFKPWYTPKDMLNLGVFGGIYFFYDAHKTDLPKELFDEIPIEKWGSQLYLNSRNYFNVNAPLRSRGIRELIPKDKMKHPAGWFQWYSRYSYGLEPDGYINKYRIIQWREEILTFSFYIETGIYTPPNPNTNNYTKYTDPSFMPLWKQHMLHYAWDCTKLPSTYGIK